MILEKAMARESTVSEKEFLQSILDLEAAGVKVTTRSVRAKLGKGSATTIARMLSEMKKQDSQAIAETKIPAHIEQAIKAALLQQAQNIEAPFKDEIEGLHQTINDVLAESERRQEEIDALEGKIASLEASKADLKGRLEESRREAAEAEARHQAEHASSKNELDRFREENSALRIQIAQANLQIQDIPATRERLATLEAENRTVLTRATNAERELAAATARVEGLTGDNKRLSEETDSAKKEILRLSTELRDATVAHKESEIRLEHAQNETQSLKDQLVATSSVAASRKPVKSKPTEPGEKP